ncbi:MAG TPA: proton-conducting transporter membrane subunit, partial [Pilimelia sp.]|nr:proton-conducting transporter membrane subunit [Pilimelia sp.]
LLTLLVAVETLTLPLYLLVALPARAAAGARAAGAAVTYFVVSVVATAVTLLGAALLYATHGHLHLDALAAGPRVAGPLAAVGTVLLVVGLAVKVAAVPLHAWAPTVYDGAPLPVAAYLSTASKLGGVVALLALWRGPLPAQWAGGAFAVLAAVTVTVGNLGALRESRVVRLLAWSSVAQLGFVLAPLAVVLHAGQRDAAAVRAAGAAALGYLLFFLVIEYGAFAAVVALRGGRGDGGTVSEYAGLGRSRPVPAAALAFALVGLAGLPPGLAGLFAKITAIRGVLGGGLLWLAVLLAANTVVGLAYYLRLAAVLYRSPTPAAPRTAATPPPLAAAVQPRLPGEVAVAVGAATAVAVLAGFAPQWVLNAAALPW